MRVLFSIFMKFNWSPEIHPKQSRYLQELVAGHTFAHAYLFYGPRGNHKERIAELLIGSIFCEDSHEVPCGRCIACRQLKNNTHPDVVRMQALEGKASISIEQIFKMQEQVALNSFLNSYKTAIIEGAHAMTPWAYNALLKILEEPPQKTIIILLAETLKNIPLTVISRAEKIKFGMLHDEPADEVSALSGQARRFLSAPNEKRFALAQEIASESRNSIDCFLSDLLALLRAILLEKAGIWTGGSFQDLALANARLVQFTSLIEKVYQLRQDMENNSNARLHLENISLMINDFEAQ